MTTNVFDISTRLMATDSRWSIDSENLIIYIDDTGFDKICVARGYALMFAGDGCVIQLWKDWIASVPEGSRGIPAKLHNAAISICVVNIDSAEIKFEYGQNIKLDMARFAGSGSIPANNCWVKHGDAKKAVDSANKIDWFSGGTITFMDFVSGDNNLQNSATIHDVNERILTSGKVMFKTNAKIVPITEAAVYDAEVRDIIGQVSDGKLTANAPCDAMYNTWDEDSINKLTAVFDEIFS